MLNLNSEQKKKIFSNTKTIFNKSLKTKTSTFGLKKKTKKNPNWIFLKIRKPYNLYLKKKLCFI